MFGVSAVNNHVCSELGSIDKLLRDGHSVGFPVVPLGDFIDRILLVFRQIDFEKLPSGSIHVIWGEDSRNVIEIGLYRLDRICFFSSGVIGREKGTGAGDIDNTVFFRLERLSRRSFCDADIEAHLGNYAGEPDYILIAGNGAVLVDIHRIAPICSSCHEETAGDLDCSRLADERKRQKLLAGEVHVAFQDCFLRKVYRQTV